MKKNTTILIILFSLTLSVFAQSNKPGNNPDVLHKGSIEEQFIFVKKKSSNYQDYKVIKQGMLNTLQQHINDSIKYFKNQISWRNKTIAEEKEAYNKLQNQLKEVQKELENSKNHEESIGFMGTQIQKKSFKKLFWGVIVILLLITGYFIYRFRNSQRITLNTLKDYEDLEKEFSEHRSRALEREQKLNRRLQDEINKHKDTSNI